MRSTTTKAAAATSLLILAYANPIVAADAPEASAKMDPCTLVSGAEARSILGVEVGAPVSGDDGLMRNCVYSSSDKRHKLTLQAKSTDKALFERAMKLRNTPIAKLGSDAYTDSGVLLLWKNGTQVNVKVNDQSGESSDEQKEVAQEKAGTFILQRL